MLNEVSLIVRGNLAHCTQSTKHTSYELQLLPDHIITVDASGFIQAVLPANAKTAQQILDQCRNGSCRVVDLNEGEFVVPGFIDCHVHAPQYSYTGTATDKPLLEWLNAYTFPAEAALKDTDKAFVVYEKLVRRLVNNGTTTAMYFCTKDVESCKVLMRSCVDAGQRALIGKVCMDRHAPDFYRETTRESVDDMEAFIQFVHLSEEGKSGLIKPVITPRFIPTCSTALLHELGRLAKTYGCHVQSHVSESVDEVKFTQALHPGEGTDSEIFDAAGLLTRRTVLAHGVHLTEKDLQLLKQRGTGISHCPLSNFYFANGSLDVKKVWRHGVDLGLGTDIAGGYSPSILNSQRTSVVASLALNAATPKEALDYKDAFYLATFGGAHALDLSSELGSLEVGKRFDAIVLGPANSIDYFGTDSLEDRFQKLLTLGDDRNVLKVFVQGKSIK